MKNILKYGLIGGGVAYVLFREQIAAFINGHATTPGGGAQPQGTNGGTTPAGTTTTTTAPAGVWAQIAAAAGNPATLNTHEWNYFYAAVRGVPGPDPASIGQGDGMRRITLAEYTAAMSAAGLSGIGRAAMRSAVVTIAQGAARGREHGQAVAAAARAASDARRAIVPEARDRKPGGTARRVWNY